MGGLYFWDVISVVEGLWIFEEVERMSLYASAAKDGSRCSVRCCSQSVVVPTSLELEGIGFNSNAAWETGTGLVMLRRRIV